MDNITRIRKNIFALMEEYSKNVGDLSEKTILDIGIEGDPKPSGNYPFFKGCKEFKTSDCNPKFSPDFVDDITDSHFPDNYWDIVICSQVIEHVWDVKSAFKHLYRIVKPGGYLIVDCPWKWDFHPSPETPDYWRLSPDAFKKLLVNLPDKKVFMTKDETLVSCICKK